jgi:hypothetical protein
MAGRNEKNAIFSILAETDVMHRPSVTWANHSTNIAGG